MWPNSSYTLAVVAPFIDRANIRTKTDIWETKTRFLTCPSQTCELARLDPAQRKSSASQTSAPFAHLRPDAFWFSGKANNTLMVEFGNIPTHSQQQVHHIEQTVSMNKTEDTHMHIMFCLFARRTYPTNPPASSPVGFP